jgi:hypothetical protein
MNSETETKKKRPVLVWLILALELYRAAGVFVGTFLVLTKQLPAQLMDKLNSLQPLDHIVSPLLMLLYVAAAIALVMLKRLAFALFALSLSLSVALALFNLSMRPAYFEVAQQTYFVPLAVGLLISLAIVIYVHRLLKRGVLT